MEVKNVLPARPDSYEHVFLQDRLARSLTDWRGAGKPNCATPRRNRGLNAPSASSTGPKRSF